MAVIYTPHFAYFTDNDGQPLAGGKLYTYEAGTTTPKATYTAQDGLTANANPIILDSSGRATLFLTGAYKFRLETSANVLVEETDNVDAFATSASGVDDIITNFTADTIVGADSIIFSDASDGNATKRSTVNGLMAVIGASMSGMILSGLTMSNNATDATNDIDIAAGGCVSDDGTTFMRLSSSITKRLDAAWAVGTGQGGLDTGSIADTTYHVWVIHRTDTEVTDVLFSTSASSPTMPTSYTKKKRIGSIVRASAAILGFTQYGNEFILKTPVLDVNSTNPGTSAVTNTLASIPTGVQMQAIMNVMVTNGTNNFVLYLSSLDSTDQTPSATVAPLGQWHDSAGTETTAAGQIRIWTNTSSQIRSRLSASGVADNFKIATVGWLDNRR